MGSQAVYEGLRKLGFGEATGMEWPNEGKGILRTPERWKEIDLATASFGHGLAVTMIQMARAYSVFANDGFLPSPKIISGIEKQEPQRVFSPATVSKIRKILLEAVNGDQGTGTRAQVNGVRVYGKTGTAHKPMLNGRGYDPDRVLSSFICFIDGIDAGLGRNLTLYVVLDEPGVKPRWGGTLAAPVFANILNRTVPYLSATSGDSDLNSESGPEQVMKMATFALNTPHVK